MQELIHKLEVGSWSGYLRNALIGLAVLALVVVYNWRCYHNMNTQEAMDSAQVARNLGEGKGFTTLFIRPLSLYLLKSRNEAKYGPMPQQPHTDYEEIKDVHPDLANAPVYPCVLAGWMKTYHLVFRALNGVTSLLPGSLKSRLPVWNDDPKNSFWEYNGKFWWAPGDFCIAMLNEGLFFIVALMTFFLARRLFDSRVAWLSMALVAGTELLWRFSVSGLSTMVLLVIFLGLVWCMVFLEQEVRDPKWGGKGLVLLPIAAGLVLGLGAMTRYGFGCLFIPALLFLIWYGGPRRISMCLLMVVVFAAVCSPWIARNVVVSGTPFGTAGYAIIDGTYLFPEHHLDRSLKPNLDVYLLSPILHKLAANTRAIVQDQAPRLGGSWAMPFFLVGLMLGFRNPALGRLRNFVLACLGTLLVAQALGQTQLSDDSPDVNSENLLVLLTPLVLIYGVSLFYILLDQMNLPERVMRMGVIGIFGLVTWLPLLGALLPPRSPATTFPPYSPATIQVISGWMNEHELIMSDVPWAVAWYGQRQCVWLTLNYQTLNFQDDFYAINDYMKPVRALYLTPETMDERFLSQWIWAGETSWGSFIVQALVKKDIPANFPLRAAPNGFLPSQLFVTDWARWKAEAATNSAANP